MRLPHSRGPLMYLAIRSSPDICFRSDQRSCARGFTSHAGSREIRGDPKVAFDGRAWKIKITAPDGSRYLDSSERANQFRSTAQRSERWPTSKCATMELNLRSHGQLFVWNRRGGGFSSRSGREGRIKQEVYGEYFIRSELFAVAKQQLHST